MKSNADSDRVQAGVYLVPRPITTHFELMPGWGLGQAVGVAGGVALGGGVLALVVALGGPLPLGLVGGVLIAGVGALAAAPQPHGSPPLYQRVQAAWRFAHHPRVLRYDWTARDDN